MEGKGKIVPTGGDSKRVVGIEWKSKKNLVGF